MANQEHLDILKHGMGIWNGWRKKHPNIKPDLSTAKLSKMNLMGVNFAGVDLSHANLRGANLTEADFSGANLAEADFGEYKEYQYKEEGEYKVLQSLEPITTETDLSGANLTRCNLSKSEFFSVNLSGANLTELDLSRSFMPGADLRGADLSHADLRGVLLIRANFHGADLREADLNHTDLSETYVSGDDVRAIDGDKATIADYDQASFVGANLSGAYLSGANLSGVDLQRGDLSDTDLTKADLRGINLAMSDLRGAILTRANLSGAILTKADLGGAIFTNANLYGAILTRANLSGIDLSETNLSEADFTEATLNKVNFTSAALVRTNLTGADLTGANLSNANIVRSRIYGISAWNVNLEDAHQEDLIITPKDEPTITVGNIEVAQFIYLLLNNKRIRDVIDTITSKVVLILGRFIPQRKIILDALRDELNKHNYTPVVSDFEKPANRDLTETVSTLAHMARFVIADITDAKSIPQELDRIVPNLPSVPVQPLILTSQHEYGMFEHFTRYPWVLPIYRYSDEASLLNSLKESIIDPAEEKAKELAKH